MDPLDLPDLIPDVPPCECETDARRAGRLARELAELQTVAEQNRAAAQERDRENERLLNELRSMYLEQCARIGRQMSALAYANANHVKLLLTLRRMVAAQEQCERMANAPPALDVLRKIMGEARQLLALLDVPFG